MKPELSIIVPVYNAESTLEKTVESILYQTFTNFELILVNDGSKDNSGNICDKYASEDKQIRVIHQENAGVSAARNAGIDAAQGSYLGFIDADDWIDRDMYARLFKEADVTNADVVMCDTITVYSNGQTCVDTITQLSSNEILKKADFKPSLLCEMAGSACRCIYNNNLISSYKIRFPVGIKFSEDRIFNLYAFGRADKVVYLKEHYYNRYMNKKSAVHRFHEDYFEACKKAAKETKKAIKEAWNDDKAIQRQYLSQLITGAEAAICNYFYKTSALSRKQRYNAVQKLCEDDMLLNAIRVYGPDRKSRMILKKQVNMLALYAKLANFKHGR